MPSRKKPLRRLKRLTRAPGRRTRLAVRRARKGKRGLPVTAEKSSLQVELAAQRLVEPAVPPPHEARAEHTDRGPMWGPIGAWALVIGVVGIALLTAGLPASERANAARAEHAREDNPADLQTTVVSAGPAPRATPVKAAQPPAKLEERAPEVRVPETRSTLLAGADVASVSSFAQLPAAEPAAVALRDAPELVTLSGCLESDDESFRLKDVSGAEAPKSRSWKTGFLTRRSAAVTVTANRLDLRAHEGRRVTLTGELTDRRLQVRSLQPLNLACGS
jgi:hypothetical protein